MTNYYDDKYQNEDLYWGKQPTSMAKKVVDALPIDRRTTILDISCGEGRDTVYFAQTGLEITAFDSSAVGVAKARAWANRLDLVADIFQADINSYRLKSSFDVGFSRFTSPGGLHAFTFPVAQPDLPKEPGSDAAEFNWEPGEIQVHYSDWIIEYFLEEVLEDESGHAFAVNRLIAQKPPRLTNSYKLPHQGENMLKNDLTLIRASISVAQRARDHGNHPFGAVLASPDGQILLEAENTVVTGADATGHAETNLIRQASKQYDRDFLSDCTLYTSTEPCPMCAGAIFWGNVGRVVFGLSQDGLYGMIDEGEDESLKLSCQRVLERGGKKIEVVGPLLEEEARVVHEGFWE